ncbi:MAG: phosphoglucosamine mutase [Anaerovoracaceae bacterium]|jgi:phosphoglucosamine mutase
MGKLFGTDGVRGVANLELTPELAFKLGKAGAFVLSKNKERPVVLIAKDTRISGDMLEDALSAGILSVGGNVIKVGILPTPAVAYLVKEYKADAGVVISASHNPYEYNGIKFFNGEGYKLDDAIEEEIEDIILNNIDINSHISGEKLGRGLETGEDALIQYADFLKSTATIDLSDMKLVIDCANGAAYKIAEKVFKDLGAEVITMANQPNGININDKCGSTYPQGLQEKVLAEKADLGLAFDGDADRLIAIDEKGRLIDGDKIIYICAKMLKEQGSLPGDMVTATVMSNIGFHRGIESIGGKVEITQVGDRYVLESMLKTGCVIGGEQSGHLIFLQYSTTGDGILSALQLIKAIKFAGKKPSELSDEVTIYPQVLKNAIIKNENKRAYMDDEEIRNEIQRVEKLMAGEGRVLIRPSGTEPMVRVMIEGKDIDEITKLAEDLAALIMRKLG